MPLVKALELIELSFQKNILIVGRMVLFELLSVILKMVKKKVNVQYGGEDLNERGCLMCTGWF